MAGYVNTPWGASAADATKRWGARQLAEPEPPWPGIVESGSMGFVFFTSYSNKNRTRPFERFVKLLQQQIFETFEPPLGSKDEVTFFAPSTLELADEWRPRLLKALQQSKVIICFCSPHYFASTYCGRELSVFQNRRDAWLKSEGHGAHRARVIFPVLWVKPQGELPQAIRRYQDDELDLPRKYKDNGLQALVQLGKERDAVKEVAIKLANSIVAAIKETSLPDLIEPLSLEEIQSVFHQQGETRRYQQAVLCLDRKGWSWQPFESGPSMSALIEPIAGASQRSWSEMSSAGELEQSFQASFQRRQAVMVVADVNALAQWQHVWTLLEDLQPQNCAVLLVWSSAFDAERVEQVQAELQARMPRYAKAPLPHSWFKIQSPAALQAALAETSATLHLRLVQGDAPVHSVEDEGRLAAAREKGQNLTVRPLLAGPGAGP
jgi:TIR domain